MVVFWKESKLFQDQLDLRDKRKGLEFSDEENETYVDMLNDIFNEGHALEFYENTLIGNNLKTTVLLSKQEAETFIFENIDEFDLISAFNLENFWIKYPNGLIEIL